VPSSFLQCGVHLTARVLALAPELRLATVRSRVEHDCRYLLSAAERAHLVRLEQLGKFASRSPRRRGGFAQVENLEGGELAKNTGATL
jgi:hypothetical protein